MMMVMMTNSALVGMLAHYYGSGFSHLCRKSSSDSEDSVNSVRRREVINRLDRLLEVRIDGRGSRPRLYVHHGDHVHGALDAMTFEIEDLFHVRDWTYYAQRFDLVPCVARAIAVYAHLENYRYDVIIVKVPASTTTTGRDCSCILM